MIVGLTGGVATGKSVVAAELKKLGAHIVDADVIARKVVEPGTPTFEEVVAEFGPAVVKADGTLDRRAIADVVFSKPERLKRLNEITHPPIRKMIREEVERAGQEHPGALIVVDAALLIENGLYQEMSRVIVVTAEERTQLERLMKRSGLDAASARRIIESQMPMDEKTKLADHVIDNNGALAETLGQVRALYDELTSIDG